VVSLDDLEAAAKAIHQKAVLDSETSAPPSTLAAEIEGQIRLIIEKSDPSEIKPPRP